MTTGRGDTRDETDVGGKLNGYKSGWNVGNCAYAVHLIKLKGRLFVFIGIYQ